MKRCQLSCKTLGSKDLLLDVHFFFFLVYLVRNIYISIDTPCSIRVGKSYMTREPNTTSLFINSSWVEAKQIQVIFGLIHLTHLITRARSVHGLGWVGERQYF